MSRSRDCLWDAEENVGDRSDRREAAGDPRTPIRSTQRRSRTADVTSPLADQRLPDADETDYRHRAAQARYRSPSGSRRPETDRNFARPSEQLIPGESTPIAKVQNSCRKRQGRFDYGDPVALDFARERRADERPTRAMSSPPLGRSRPAEPAMQIPLFDGKSDLRIFLMRFSTIANFYSWDERERGPKELRCV